MFTVDRNFFCSPKRKGTRVSLAFCCKLWNHTLVFVNSFRVFFFVRSRCVHVMNKQDEYANGRGHKWIYLTRSSNLAWRLRFRLRFCEKRAEIPRNFCISVYLSILLLFAWRHDLTMIIGRCSFRISGEDNGLYY